MIELYVKMRREKMTEKEILDEFRKYINEHDGDRIY